MGKLPDGPGFLPWDGGFIRGHREGAEPGRRSLREDLQLGREPNGLAAGNAGRTGRGSGRRGIY